MEKILVLQYACTTVGDEAEAKLARQLPRAIGTKLHATELFRVQFLALYHAVDGVPHFINTTATPAKEDLREIAADNNVRFVLCGKVGAKERITIDAQLYDAEQDAIVYRKFFETYAGYTIDALDEIAYRVAIHVGATELSQAQRVALFQRDTTSWEAQLYYFMAEDDRYGMSIDVLPPEPLLAVSAYTEALRIDPTMQAAEEALLAFLAETVARNIVPSEKAIEVLRALANEDFVMEMATVGLSYFLMAYGQPHEAETTVRAYLQKHGDSSVMLKALAVALAEQGSVAEAERLLRDAAEKYDTSSYFAILVEFYHEYAGSPALADCAERRRKAESRAEDARAREALAALPILNDDHCSLN